MKLEDILNHPADQAMVFEGEEMLELLGHLVQINSDLGATEMVVESVAAYARRVILNLVGTPPSHGIPFAYLIGRHWTYEPKDCKHEQFRIGADIGRILKDGTDTNDPEQEPAYYSASIRVTCQNCGDPFEFVGLPFGFSPYRPTMSLDGREMHVSVMPAGKSVQSGLVGFGVTQTVFEDGKGSTRLYEESPKAKDPLAN